MCVCVCGGGGGVGRGGFGVCVLFTYTNSIGIICVSQEEPSLIASSQQMNNLQPNTF